MASRETHDFLLYIAAARRRTAKLEDARPGLAQIGPFIIEFHAEYAATLWDDPVRSAEVPLRPIPNSLGDESGLPNLSPENKLVLEELHISLTAARDHLLGLGRLFLAGGPNRTAIAVARSLLDASAHALWLLDPCIDSRQRTGRAANLRLISLAQEIADKPSPKLVEDFERQRTALVANAKLDGYEQIFSKKGAPQWMLAPPYSIDAVWSVCEGRQLAQTAWRLNSSAVHARERQSLQRDLGLLASRNVAAVERATIQHCMYPVLLASEVALIAGQFYGLNANPITPRVVGRLREAFALGAGLRDDSLVPPIAPPT